MPKIRRYSSFYFQHPSKRTPTHLCTLKAAQWISNSKFSPVAKFETDASAIKDGLSQKYKNANAFSLFKRRMLSLIILNYVMLEMARTSWFTYPLYESTHCSSLKYFSPPRISKILGSLLFLLLVPDLRKLCWHVVFSTLDFFLPLRHRQKERERIQCITLLV